MMPQSGNACGIFFYRFLLFSVWLVVLQSVVDELVVFFSSRNCRITGIYEILPILANVAAMLQLENIPPLDVNAVVIAGIVSADDVTMLLPGNIAKNTT